MENQTSFVLPRFREIPNVGLFLEQVAKYLNEFLAPLDGSVVTGNMISNYVKMGLITRPYKKQYDRQQIATLMFISVTKSAISLEDVHILLLLQKETGLAFETVYNFFCIEMEKAVININNGGCLALIKDLKKDDYHKRILLNTILTVANKAYLERQFFVLKQEHFD